MTTSVRSENTVQNVNPIVGAKTVVRAIQKTVFVSAGTVGQGRFVLIDAGLDSGVSTVLNSATVTTVLLVIILTEHASVNRDLQEIDA